jgi:pSer/pThr/pTyr-binding forkhead associated (FHA) protein
MMPARLVAIDGRSDIPLNRPMVIVGRHPTCDVRLDSPRVSRRHCCVHLQESSVVVCDLGSTNGIQINGARVVLGRLRPGDELSIAHRRYRFLDGPDQDRHGDELPTPYLAPSPALPPEPAKP